MQTAAMTTICSAAAAIINVVTRLDASWVLATSRNQCTHRHIMRLTRCDPSTSLSVYYCLQYPLPALCKSRGLLQSHAPMHGF